MPFPLAHPAAVLPLSRLCPRRLNFPALIIGSLSPDFAYFFGARPVAQFSHSFLAGSLGFDLPVGLLVLVIFYKLRRRLPGLLPIPYRAAVLQPDQRTVGWGLAILSLLIGAWTHILLDSMTHDDGWLVERVRVLQCPVPGLGKDGPTVHQLLYHASTFAGVTWVALSYLGWLGSVPGLAIAGGLPARWPWALVSAGAVFFVAAASRGPHPRLGLIPAGILTVLLVVGFVFATPRSIASRGLATRETGCPIDPRNPDRP